MTFYTDNLIPADSAGCTRGPVIFIRPKYRNDIGLLRHEECHVRQWLRTLGLHSILYLLSKKYRLKAEVEAYREQLKWTGFRSDRLPDYYINLYAGWLAAPGWTDGYDLQDIVTKEEALALLS